jgi:hypothetical protein
MVEDIKIILESRAKEFHLNSLEKKLKAPVVPEQLYCLFI